jgi:Rrf2 family protein
VISQKSRHALRALLVIASKGDGATVQISEIIRHSGIPKKFLQFILLELKNNGLLISRRGPMGGYSLSRPADKINFADVLRITDGPLALTPCVSVTAYSKCKDCFEETTCAIRRVLLRVRNTTANILESNSLADALIAERQEEIA